MTCVGLLFEALFGSKPACVWALLRRAVLEATSGLAGDPGVLLASDFSSI